LSWTIYIIIFYIIFGFIFANFLLLAYIGYNGSVYGEKKNRGNLVGFILRINLSLFTTVLYQPFVIYLLSISSCVENSENQLTHYFFPEIQCWSGSHIMHAIFSFIIFIMFLLICFLSSLILFDNRLNFANPSAKYTF